MVEKKNNNTENRSSCAYDDKTQNRVKEPAVLLRQKTIKPVSLESVVPGQVIQEDDAEFLLIKRGLCESSRKCKALFKKYKNSLITLEHCGEDNLQLLNKTAPENVLFLDIETCGLTANPLFLIGAAFAENNTFILLQFFARNYDEERPLLSFFSRFLGRFDTLVTYNGRSFDMPFILSRAHENRVSIRDEIDHLDLLIEVRRKWKREMPDCKLQTVEHEKLDFVREGDVPGIEIPRLYHEFVDTGNPDRIMTILEHNVRDILSLVEIVIQFSAECNGQ
ncbi:ribonuclease H-like domain-containing protein [candidate division KSB1 bacterium]